MRRLAALAIFLISAGAGAWLTIHAPRAVARETGLLELRLREVSVRGLEKLSAAEVVVATGLQSGTPLLEVDPAAVEARLQEHPWILGVRATRLPPSRLLLDVQERRPAAVASIDEALYLVDVRGTPFAPAAARDAEALPVFRAVPESTPGRESSALAEGLRLVWLLRRHSLPEVAELWLAPEPQELGITLRLRGGPARIVLGAAPFEPKLERLERLLAAQLPEMEAATWIDLRFADRVVLRSALAPEGVRAAMARGCAASPRPDQTG